MPEQAPKRLVFCFDGTMKRLAVDTPTNVARLAQMVLPLAGDGTPQIVYYDEGIGTSHSLPIRLRDAMFGRGMVPIMRNAFRFLIFNYEPGDEIYAFGFSRGAFTARSFMGLIRHAGIPDPQYANKIDNAIRIYREAPAKNTGEESPEGLEFRQNYCTRTCVSTDDRTYRIENGIKGAADLKLVDLRYVGAFDSVRALGLPKLFPFSGRLNGKHDFHDAALSSKIRSARHGVALDEVRHAFRPTMFGREKVHKLNQLTFGWDRDTTLPWDLPYQEKWFPGVHGSVGGGGSRRGLSDAALAWIVQGAVKQGLQLRSGDSTGAFDLRPRFTENLENSTVLPLHRRGLPGWFLNLGSAPRVGPAHRDEIALSTFQRWFAPVMSIDEETEYRPAALSAVRQAMESWPYGDLPEYKSAHVVQRGESLRSIAKKRLGDTKFFYEIFGANLDQLDDPDFIAIGQVLRLPPVGTKAEPIEPPKAETEIETGETEIEIGTGTGIEVPAPAAPAAPAAIP